MFEYWGLFYVGGLGVLLGLFGLLFRDLFYFFINIQFGVLGGGAVRRIYEKGMENLLLVIFIFVVKEFIKFWKYMCLVYLKNM